MILRGTGTGTGWVLTFIIRVLHFYGRTEERSGVVKKKKKKTQR